MVNLIYIRALLLSKSAYVTALVDPISLLLTSRYPQIRINDRIWHDRKDCMGDGWMDKARIHIPHVTVSGRHELNICCIYCVPYMSGLCHTE